MRVEDALDLRRRRLIFMPKKYSEMPKDKVYYVGYRPETKAMLLKWVAKNTSGQFYLGQNLLYLENEEDVTMLILSGVLNKIVKPETLI